MASVNVQVSSRVGVAAPAPVGPATPPRDRIGLIKRAAPSAAVLRVIFGFILPSFVEPPPCHCMSGADWDLPPFSAKLTGDETANAKVFSLSQGRC